VIEKLATGPTRPTINFYCESKAASYAKNVSKKGIALLTDGCTYQVFEFRNEPGQQERIVCSPVLPQHEMVRVFFFIALKAIRSKDVLLPSLKLMMGLGQSIHHDGDESSDNYKEDATNRCSSRIRNNQNNGNSGHGSSKHTKFYLS
jgi:hypothetical protein